MRWFSIAVISYMIVGICWWSFLLFKENNEKHQLKLELAKYQAAELSEVESEYERRSFMIFGEGLVLIISLIAGVWIINRSALKEIKTASIHSNFLLSVSHELKSPIAAVKLALETLRRPKLAHRDAEEITNRAIQDAVRLESLVENILVSAHLDHQALQLVKDYYSVESVLSSIIKKVQRFQHRIVLNVHENATVGMLYIDKQNFERCVENLISNAGQYSTEDHKIELNVWQKENNFVFEIMDEGPGIAIEDQEKMFEKFHRGSQSQVGAVKGTGLGLYISSQIAIAHGGKLVYNERPSGGSIFTLEIPSRTSHSI